MRLHDLYVASKKRVFFRRHVQIMHADFLANDNYLLRTKNYFLHICSMDVIDTQTELAW